MDYHLQSLQCQLLCFFYSLAKLTFDALRVPIKVIDSHHCSFLAKNHLNFQFTLLDYIHHSSNLQPTFLHFRFFWKSIFIPNFLSHCIFSKYLQVIQGIGYFVPSIHQFDLHNLANLFTSFITILLFLIWHYLFQEVLPNCFSFSAYPKSFSIDHFLQEYYHISRSCLYIF